MENPARPSNLAASSTSSTVTLTWDNPGDSTITGYKILSRNTATESILTVLVSDTGRAGTSYTVSGLEPGTTYQFAVLAVNNAGNSVPSQIVTVSTRAQTAPPSDATALASIIESLTGIIEGLSLKITALEAEIVDLRGTLGGRIVAPVTDSGDFVPVYYAATSQHNLAQKSHYEDRLFLENFAGHLTQALVLPYDVHLTMDECGEPEAAYDPYYKRIVVCYELVTFLEGRLAPYYNTDAELSRDVDGFVTWVMLHELGHALIDAYGLPVTGNEEDAVDQFAILIALEYIPPDQAGNIFSYLRPWFGQTIMLPTEVTLAGPHSLDSQRFDNVACWLYGGDVSIYSNFANRGLLTEARAGQCQFEFERMSERWHRLVSPFLIEDDPVIRLNGAPEVRLNVGDAYTEAGATCTDAKDDTLEVARTSDAPDTTRAGTYQLEYSCTDAAGNTATTTRTVVVIGPTVDNPPTLDINPRTVTITAGVTYDVLTGVTCTDDQVTNIAPTIVSNPFDPTTPGTYTITYSCDDGTNPAVTGTRTITVEQHPTRASIAFDVDVGKWDNGRLDLDIAGTATDVSGDLILTTTIPGHEGPFTVTLGSGGSISEPLILTNISVEGPHEVTLASASVSTIRATESVTMPPILRLDNVVGVGSDWIGDATPSDVHRFELWILGSAGVDDRTRVFLDAPDVAGFTGIPVPVEDDGSIDSIVNMTNTGVSGYTEFVLTASSRTNDATSNSDRVTIPALLGIQVTPDAAGWSGGELHLNITGSNATAIPSDTSLVLQLLDGDAAVELTAATDGALVMNEDGISGAVTLDSGEWEYSGKEVTVRLSATGGGVTTLSPVVPVSIDPILTNLQVTPAGSNAGQWNNGNFEVRVTGLSSGIPTTTGIDLQAATPTGWTTVVEGATGTTGALQILGGGDIRATVSIQNISLYGDTVFRLVTDTASAAESANSTALRIPHILASLPTVTPIGAWAANGELTINVKGTSGLGTSGASLQLQAVRDAAVDNVGGAFAGALTGGNIDYNAILSDVSLSGTTTAFKLAVTVGGNVAESGNRIVSIPAALTLTDVSFGSAGWTNTTADNHRLNLFVTGNSQLGAGAMLQVSSDNGETWTDVGAASSTAGGISDAVIALTDTTLAGESVQFRLDADSNANTAVSAPLSRVVPALPASGSSVDMTPTPISFSTQNGFPPTTGAAINYIPEILAVHTVQVTQSSQTLTTLARPVVNP